MVNGKGEMSAAPQQIEFVVRGDSARSALAAVLARSLELLTGEVLDPDGELPDRAVHCARAGHTCRMLPALSSRHLPMKSPSLRIAFARSAWMAFWSGKMAFALGPTRILTTPCLASAAGAGSTASLCPKQGWVGL